MAMCMLCLSGYFVTTLSLLRAIYSCMCCMHVSMVYDYTRSESSCVCVWNRSSSRRANLAYLDVHTCICDMGIDEGIIVCNAILLHIIHVSPAPSDRNRTCCCRVDVNVAMYMLCLSECIIICMWFMKTRSES